MSIPDLIIDTFQQYAQSLIEKIPALIAALVVFALFVMIGGLIRFSVRDASQKRRVQLIARIVHVVLLIIGAIIGLGIVGINIGGLLAGLGLLSVGFSFALQDLLVNFLAGLQLLGQNSFEIGDMVEITGIQGTVRSIGTRSVKLRTNSGSTVYVPNRDLLLKPVEVYSGAGSSYLLFKLTVPLNRLNAVYEQSAKTLASVSGIAQDSAHLSVTGVHKDHADVVLRAMLVEKHPSRSQVYSEGLRVLSRLLVQE